MDKKKNEMVAIKREVNGTCSELPEREQPRRNAKVVALLIAVAVIVLSFATPDRSAIAIYTGCGVQGRLLYSFYHANVLHAALNAWCLLSLVFIYDITMRRLLLAYFIAILVPIDTLGIFIDGMASPTVGLSAIVFILFGSISFEVRRKCYYQAWMLLYLLMGFLFPNTNAGLHLYCYLAGLVGALLNKPVKSKHYDR